MANKKILSLVLIVLSTSVVCRGEVIKVGISHVNDISGQIETYKPGTNASSKAPVECETKQKECMGGLQNVVHWLWENGTIFHDDVLEVNRWRLGTGNLIGGESGWISSISDSWTSYAQIIQKHMRLTTTALGMKEFGAGLAQARTFATWLNLDEGNRTLVANTCHDGTYKPAVCTNITDVKLMRLEPKDGTDYYVGIIGFINPLVERLSIPGNLTFSDVASSLKDSISKHPDVNIFIAIGDGNLNMAKEIIDAEPKIKLVIYGSGFANTNTATYPLQYKDRYIATAGRYGSTVGKLLLNIDTVNHKLEVVKSQLQPTVHPGDYNAHAKDPGLVETIGSWRKTVQSLRDTRVGLSRVNLTGGELCWQNECNIGNLMTDAVVHCVYTKTKFPFPFYLHSLWHGGAFFEEVVKNGENITKFDIHKWLPYHNRVHLVYTTGKNLWKVLQLSASGLDPDKAGLKQWRQFLQVSNGMEVFYDTKSGSVTRVRMTHDNDGVPSLQEIDMDNKLYYFLIPTYLKEGRGVYESVKDIWTSVDFHEIKSDVGFDDECLEGYITAIGQVSVGVEERIWINEESGHPATQKTCGKTGKTVILTIVFTLIFLGVVYIGYFYVIPRLRQSNVVEYPPNQL